MEIFYFAEFVHRIESLVYDARCRYAQFPPPNGMQNAFNHFIDRISLSRPNAYYGQNADN